MSSAQGCLTLALTPTPTLTRTLTRRRLVLTALDAVTVGGHIVPGRARVRVTMTVGVGGWACKGRTQTATVSLAWCTPA